LLYQFCSCPLASTTDRVHVYGLILHSISLCFINYVTNSIIICVNAFSWFAETAVESNKKNAAAETGERLSQGGTPKRLNSQHDDPDFEPYSEDTLDCFEISVTCQKKKKKNAGLSSQPSSSRKGRNLRKKAKY
jgi:hypothetical protein